MTQNQDDDDWVSAAMADDSAVAHLLTRLRRPPSPPPRSSLSPPPLEWTVKQPRSKPAQRSSPATPLSWSGANSADGGSEESRRRTPPELPEAIRSKVTAVSGININKRSRKKKTLVELKEEETLLVKERKNLKRKLATLRDNLENQRAINESLKRYKIVLQSQPAGEKALGFPSIKAIPNQMLLHAASFAHTGSSILPEEIRNEDFEALKRIPHAMENSSENFVLPDLNLPFDAHTTIEVL